MLTKMKEKKDKLVAKAYRVFTPDDAVKITQAMMAAGISLSTMPMIAMAGADAMFSTLIGLVCKIFFYIGAILLVWAVGQLVLAFKNEDADSKSRAVMVLVCAVLLMSIKTIYTSIAGQMEGGLQPSDNVQI